MEELIVFKIRKYAKLVGEHLWYASQVLFWWWVYYYYYCVRSSDSVSEEENEVLSE